MHISGFCIQISFSDGFCYLLDFYFILFVSFIDVSQVLEEGWDRKAFKIVFLSELKYI